MPVRLRSRSSEDPRILLISYRVESSRSLRLDCWRSFPVDAALVFGVPGVAISGIVALAVELIVPHREAEIKAIVLAEETDPEIYLWEKAASVPGQVSGAPATEAQA